MTLEKLLELKAMANTAIANGNFTNPLKNEECSYLGDTLISLAGTYENSEDDIKYINAVYPFTIKALVDELIEAKDIIKYYSEQHYYDGGYYDVDGSNAQYFMEKWK